jgi:hypothetical protein
MPKWPRACRSAASARPRNTPTWWPSWSPRAAYITGTAINLDGGMSPVV